MRMQVPSLALLSGLKIQGCHKLRHGSQMPLGSCVAMAVAQAGSCSSDSTHSLGSSYATGAALKRKEKKKIYSLNIFLVQYYEWQSWWLYITFPEWIHLTVGSLYFLTISHYSSPIPHSPPLFTTLLVSASMHGAFLDFTYKWYHLALVSLANPILLLIPCGLSCGPAKGLSQKSWLLSKQSSLFSISSRAG